MRKNIAMSLVILFTITLQDPHQKKLRAVLHKNHTDNVWLEGASLLQDLMPDNNEWEGESTAKEQHHHAKKPPLVLYREWQVLSWSLRIVTGANRRGGEASHGLSEHSALLKFEICSIRV